MFAFVQASAMQNDFVYRHMLRKKQATFLEVYRLAYAFCGDNAPALNWLDVLPEEEAVWEEIVHPLFVYWLEQRLLPALRSRDVERMQGELAQAGRYFWMVLQKRGTGVQELEIALDDRGELRFPGQRRYLAFGDEARWQVVRLTRVDVHLTIRALEQEWCIRWGELLGTEAVVSEVVRSRGNQMQVPMELSPSDPLIREFLDVDFRDILSKFQQEDCEGLSFYEELTLADVWYYEKAFEQIRAYWPAMYEEIVGHMRMVTLVDTERIGGATTPCIQGAIFLSHRLGDMQWTIENMIHEFAHARLYQLCELDPLLLNTPDQRFASPWRKDPRPMEGILQGMFVFTRVVLWYRILLEQGDAREVRERLGVVLGELQAAAEVLEAHGTFTELGRALFAEMKQHMQEVMRATSWSLA